LLRPRFPCPRRSPTPERSQVAATVLALFCLATAAFFHTNFADPNQIFHFIKNLVMTGGLLQVVNYGAGAISVDSKHSKNSAS
jgi:putative oxidoreductase